MADKKQHVRRGALEGRWAVGEEKILWFRDVAADWNLWFLVK